MNTDSPTYTAMIVGKSIVVALNGRTVSIPEDASNYVPLLAAIRDKRSDEEVSGLMTPVEHVKTVCKEAGFEIRINVEKDLLGVFWEGKPLHTKACDMILSLYKEGQDFAGMKNFVVKAASNKIPGDIDALYEFVMNNKLPIHPDGDFLAFKTTRLDGFDKYSGTVKYEIGKYLEVTNFDPDKNTQCGAGLHVGGRNYVSGYGNAGDAYFIVKVNPADAVFFNADASGGKMRVRKLFVYAQTFGGAELFQVLPFMVASSPEGDLLEEAAAEEIAAGTSTESAPMGKRSSSVVVAKGSAKVKKDRKLRKAQKEQSFKTGSKSNLKFITKAGVVYTESQVKKNVEDFGQRGWAAKAGIPRSTIQEWLKAIAGETRKR